jgi:hypothetical protein
MEIWLPSLLCAITVKPLPKRKKERKLKLEPICAN